VAGGAWRYDVKIQVSVEVRGQEPRTVRITPMAIIGWERQTGKRLSDLGDGMSLSDVSVMTYEQVRLQGEIPEGLSMDGWLASLDALDPVAAEVPESPGQDLSDAS
jgi:hypothetical protein